MLRVCDRAGPAEGLRVAPSSVWPSASLNSVGADQVRNARQMLAGLLMSIQADGYFKPDARDALVFAPVEPASVRPTWPA